ncbi:hypothetical protein [Vibrio vulnificus]|uniref:hypothetical protein n=1 Tax=Vibrio vulnificus TaxID=672 RepID=UPI0019D45169|nr:hypothetical protein [Vibrio vulnificus]EGR0106744.1 hypothetical protein [Vibrio vulnificus]MBN8114968.1 hypothetical protein [Vibrio vulnificus]MCA3963491.1 hypothetical protein [Vibrio vulnificus]MCU8572413.1 hypothetical protein [Vibrio vulnificus]
MTVKCKVSMGESVQSLLAQYQAQYNDAFRSGCYTDVELANHAKEWLDSEPDLAMLDGPNTPLSVYNSYYSNLKRPHGGKRKGAGRKKQTPSVVIRVPEPLQCVVKDLVELYKSSPQLFEHHESCRYIASVKEEDLIALFLDWKGKSEA